MGEKLLDSCDTLEVPAPCNCHTLTLQKETFVTAHVSPCLAPSQARVKVVHKPSQSAPCHSP